MTVEPALPSVEPAANPAKPLVEPTQALHPLTEPGNPLMAWSQTQQGELPEIKLDLQPVSAKRCCGGH